MTPASPQGLLLFAIVVAIVLTVAVGYWARDWWD